jgi:3-oxoacyl-[acyl-carrier protein] reductase
VTDGAHTTTGSGLSGGDPQERRPELDLAGVPQEVIDKYNLAALPLDRPNRPTSELLRLDGRVAVVTGGGGSGLGDSICHRLAEAGASIAVLDANVDAAATTARSVSDLWKVDTLPVAGNVSDWEQAHDAVARVVDRFGTVDILVNNAGGSGAVGAGGQRLTGSAAFADANRDDIDLTVAVNFLGAMYMTRAALDVMLPRGRGRIINIASEGGKVGMAGSVVYSASKTAVIGFTRNLAHEVGPLGVSIVALCPGIMINERLLHLWAAEPAAGGALDYSFMRSTIGRATIPDEIASTVAFLASDAGAYAHGTAISIGGGLSD